jgi:hypothetical protein
VSAFVHETVVAPLALGLALRHAARAMGARRALGEIAALVLYGFCLERAAMSVFASHNYGSAWLATIAGVPVAVAAVWAALILSAISVSRRLGLRTATARAIGAALAGASLDMLIEPVAIRAGLWRWTPSGPWLGVPLGNFVGWAIIVGVYAFGAELWDAGASPFAALARRCALAAVSIACLIGVGLAWTRFRVEDHLQGATAWCVWAGVLALTSLWGGHAPSRPWLGAEPVAIFALLFATFATDALLLRDPVLVSAIAGTGAALVSLLTRAYRKSFFRLVSAPSLGERLSSSSRA